jgi:hypothetical protein
LGTGTTAASPTTANTAVTAPSPIPPTVQGASDTKQWWQVILEFFGR